MCTSTSKCIYKTCECKQLGKNCNPSNINEKFCEKCNCIINKCKNLNNNIDDDQISEIIMNMKIMNIHDKIDLVFEKRQGIDLYTLKKRNEIIKPVIDHIIEYQIVGHAVYLGLKNQSYTPYYDGLKSSLNDIQNYNVTENKINSSKGSVIKNYFNSHFGEPLHGSIKNRYVISIKF
jgi:hypothetical protein